MREIQLPVLRERESMEVSFPSRASPRVADLTASGYVQVEKETVLALVRQEGGHLLELLVPAERHLQERRGVIDDVRIVLRAHRAEGVRQLDAVPGYRRDRGTEPQFPYRGCGIRYTAKHLHGVQVPAVQLLRQ